MSTLPVYLRLRRELLNAIIGHLEHDAPTRAQLARQLAISLARVTDLRAGRIELFSLDALVKLAGRAGLNVTLSATRPYGQNRVRRRAR